MSDEKFRVFKKKVLKAIFIEAYKMRIAGNGERGIIMNCGSLDTILILNSHRLRWAVRMGDGIIPLRILISQTLRRDSVGRPEVDGWRI